MRIGKKQIKGSLTADTWIKVYDSILESNTASVTISGLDGDTDEEYRLLIRVVTAANGINVFISPNNDTNTSNYGGQWLHGSSSTADAYRQTTGYGFYIHPWSTVASGKVIFSDTIIYAKSGNSRQAISFDILVDGTTINDLSNIAGVWNNTVANITSLVIWSDVANGLGTGTSIELWKKVNKI